MRRSHPTVWTIRAPGLSPGDLARYRFEDMKRICAMSLLLTAIAFAQDGQWVEGFDKVEFHHDAAQKSEQPRLSRDGPWVHDGRLVGARADEEEPGFLENRGRPGSTGNHLRLRRRHFCSSLGNLYGPTAELTVNGRHALKFTLGLHRDFTWREGEYELKYVSKRIEFPYFGTHRQFELNGNSGIYQLTVPADAVKAGEPALLQVEVMPFERWNGGWFMVKERRDTLKQSMESLQGEIEALRQDMAIVNQQTHMLATQVYSDLVDKGKFDMR